MNDGQCELESVEMKTTQIESSFQTFLSQNRKKEDETDRNFGIKSLPGNIISSCVRITINNDPSFVGCFNVSIFFNAK